MNISILKWESVKKFLPLFVYIDHQFRLDIFETFADNFELPLHILVFKNQFLIVVLGNFNAKAINCFKGDTNSYEA